MVSDLERHGHGDSYSCIGTGKAYLEVIWRLSLYIGASQSPARQKTTYEKQTPNLVYFNKLRVCVP